MNNNDNIIIIIIKILQTKRQKKNRKGTEGEVRLGLRDTDNWYLKF